ncbi:nucleotidyltransferase domain-containing protein [Sporosarcina sp. BI001-red]|uniref:nucleotidyltransferase domain-containing protein n=1 Tax=Sporosarcina sp. BI001-red TaxID=2282866 RepID=UPI000E25133F|nr:nucleotidyltransferase domain-containing protein [Sporosarcina sp. BI001-red]REB11028.1 nucleotidyltransferase domain-containing protein [Sporosarcina sp. BI001-red]
MEPIKAARLFVTRYFPNCQGALMAGSVVRGEATATSDLDIIIFDKEVSSSSRHSLTEFNWPIEVFVHNLTSYQSFFESDRKRARPSLQRMVAEGIVLKDDGVIESIKQEANRSLQDGPDKWTEKVIRTKRYFLTDVLEDFIGATTRAEELMIVNNLADSVQEFVLRTNGCWLGSGKWIIRELQKFDSDFADQFVNAIDRYYRDGEKTKVIELVDTVLEPFGGRLFNGFSIGTAYQLNNFSK